MDQLVRAARSSTASLDMDDVEALWALGLTIWGVIAPRRSEVGIGSEAACLE